MKGTFHSYQYTNKRKTPNPCQKLSKLFKLKTHQIPHSINQWKYYTPNTVLPHGCRELMSMAANRLEECTNSRVPYLKIRDSSIQCSSRTEPSLHIETSELEYWPTKWQKMCIHALSDDKTTSKKWILGQTWRKAPQHLPQAFHLCSVLGLHHKQPVKGNHNQHQASFQVLNQWNAI